MELQCVWTALLGSANGVSLEAGLPLWPTNGKQERTSSFVIIFLIQFGVASGSEITHFALKSAFYKGH